MHKKANTLIGCSKKKKKIRQFAPCGMLCFYRDWFRWELVIRERKFCNLDSVSSLADTRSAKAVHIFEDSSTLECIHGFLNVFHGNPTSSCKQLKNDLHQYKYVAYQYEHPLHKALLEYHRDT